MKKIIFHTSLFALIAALLLGCVKDKGNYEIHEIPNSVTNGFTVMINANQATINNKNRIQINANDHIKIVINDKIGQNFEPIYRWYLYEIDPILQPGKLPDPAIEIASTKDFDQKFNKGPGKYKLYRKTTNNTNGDAYFEEFIIEVESINGLLVYHKNGNENAVYSVIRTTEMGLDLPAEKMGLNKNVYSNINNGRSIEKPTYLWLRLVNDLSYDNEILADSENGLTLINYKTNIYKHNNYNSFFAFPLENSPAPQGHMNGSNKVEYLVQHGALYYMNYMSGSKSPKFVQLSEPGMTYSRNMMTIPTSLQPFRPYSNVVFNETLKRFEYDNGGFLMPFASIPGPLGQLDVDLSATNMDLVYMAKGKDYTINAIMKNDQGNLRCLSFDITDPMAAVCTNNIDLAALGTVNENSIWAISERGPIVFFTKDNAIHTLNYETGQMDIVLNDIPNGGDITVLEILKDNENPTYSNAILFIGYNQGNEGTLLQYEFNPISGKLKTESKKAFSSFGKILDVVLKK